jgi:hypothetical protein
MIVIVLTFVLGGLANNRAYACACGPADKGALEAASEDCAERRTARSADKCAFARANPALLGRLAVVVMVVTIMTVVIVSAVTTAAHSVVVSAIVVLRKRGDDRSSVEERSDKDGFSKRAHLPLDAGFHDHRLFPLQIPLEQMATTS